MTENNAPGQVDRMEIDVIPILHVSLPWICVFCWGSVRLSQSAKELQLGDLELNARARCSDIFNSLYT